MKLVARVHEMPDLHIPWYDACHRRVIGEMRGVLQILTTVFESMHELKCEQSAELPVMSIDFMKEFVHADLLAWADELVLAPSYMPPPPDVDVSQHVPSCTWSVTTSCQGCCPCTRRRRCSRSSACCRKCRRVART